MDGTPQRPPRHFLVPALIFGVVCLLALVRPAVAQTGFLANGDFEAGVTGWTALGDVVLHTDTSAGGVDGPSALHVTSANQGVYRVRSVYWLSAPITPGAAYWLEAWILDNDPGVAVFLGLDFLNQDGTPLPVDASAGPSVDAPAFQRLAVQHVAPAGSVYARTVFEGHFDGGGATFAVDGVVLAQVGAPPAVEPTIQPPPPPAPVVAPPTLTPTPSATPTATPTPRPTATPRPTPLPIGPSLRLAHDGDIVAPWDVTRGVLEPAPGGNGLLFRVDGGATAWVQQGVTVAPGAWYQAAARLTPVEGVRAAWVRIAWYASHDASGAQIETDDSDSVAGDGSLAIVVAGGLVSTGPVEVPAGAHSAKIRILLQPENEAGAAVIIEAVAFEIAQKPAPPVVSPSPTPGSTRTPSPTSTPSAAAALATPPPGGGSPPSSPPPAIAAGDLAAQASLRITEAMPDPIQPGRDADYEWVELTNIGDIAVSLGGMALRDAHSATPLPSVVVPPGASVVIAGRLAEVDADVRLDRAIGNGLGNEGDHLGLLDASGEVTDGFEYGRGTDLIAGPGESIHRWFDASGAIVGAGVGEPSPGVHAPLVASVEAASNVASGIAAVGSTEEPPAPSEDAVAAPSDSANVPAWVVLLAIGGGALGGVAVQRLGLWRSRSSGSVAPRDT